MSCYLLDAYMTLWLISSVFLECNRMHMLFIIQITISMSMLIMCIICEKKKNSSFSKWSRCIYQATPFSKCQYCLTWRIFNVSRQPLTIWHGLASKDCLIKISHELFYNFVYYDLKHLTLSGVWNKSFKTYKTWRQLYKQES